MRPDAMAAPHYEYNAWIEITAAVSQGVPEPGRLLADAEGHHRQPRRAHRLCAAMTSEWRKERARTQAIVVARLNHYAFQKRTPARYRCVLMAREKRAPSTPAHNSARRHDDAARSEPTCCKLPEGTEW